MTLSEILTIEDVSKYLRISERTVYEWAQKGEIPAGKLGSSWRFKRSEIEKWVDDRLGTKRGRTAPQSVSIREVLHPKRVSLLSGRRKEEALKELVALLASAPEVGNRGELETAIFHREELMSTGIGLGVAVPHVRLPSVSKIVMAVGISRSGIADYESMDGKPVHFVFMTAAGKDQHATYIKTLAAVSTLMKDESFRKELLEAPTPEDIYKILVEGGV